MSCKTEHGVHHAYIIMGIVYYTIVLFHSVEDGLRVCV